MDSPGFEDAIAAPPAMPVRSKSGGAWEATATGGQQRRAPLSLPALFDTNCGSQIDMSANTNAGADTYAVKSPLERLRSLKQNGRSEDIQELGVLRRRPRKGSGSEAAVTPTSIADMPGEARDHATDSVQPEQQEKPGFVQPCDGDNLQGPAPPTSYPDADGACAGGEREASDEGRQLALDKNKDRLREGGSSARHPRIWW